MISAETAARTWDRIAQYPPERVQGLLDQLWEEQPIVAHYLVDLDDFPFSQHEQHIVWFIGLVVWQVMEQAEPPPGEVTVEVMDQADEDNYRFLEQLASDTPTDFYSAIQSMLERYPEPEVLRMVVAALQGQQEVQPEEDALRRENSPLALILLKAVLDAFICSQE